MTNDSATRTAIERAIEGGFDFKGLFRNHGAGEPSWYMLSPTQVRIIVIAVPLDAPERQEYDISISDLLLSPAFWVALGKAEGWHPKVQRGKCGNPDCDGSGCFVPGTGVYLYYWHRLIDHLAEGKDIDSFFATILKTDE